MAYHARRGRPAFDDVLTPTEWQVAHAVRHGLSNRRIATARAISIDGVKYHVANILAKTGLKNRLALRQWQGIPNTSALNQEQPKMNATSMGGIGQIARSVSDIASSIAWYRDVLGLPHLFTAGTMAFFECGGTRLMLAQQAAPEAESILYFKVDSILATHQRLSAMGVTFRNAPHMVHRHADGTEEWMAFFHDPDRRTLAIMAQVRPAVAD